MLFTSLGFVSALDSQNEPPTYPSLSLVFGMKELPAYPSFNLIFGMILSAIISVSETSDLIKRPGVFLCMLILHLRLCTDSYLSLALAHVFSASTGDFTLRTASSSNSDPFLVKAPRPLNSFKVGFGESLCL